MVLTNSITTEQIKLQYRKLKHDLYQNEQKIQEHQTNGEDPIEIMTELLEERTNLNQKIKNLTDDVLKLYISSTDMQIEFPNSVHQINNCYKEEKENVHFSDVPRTPQEDHGIKCPFEYNSPELYDWNPTAAEDMIVFEKQQSDFAEECYCDMHVCEQRDGYIDDQTKPFDVLSDTWTMKYQAPKELSVISETEEIEEPYFNNVCHEPLFTSPHITDHLKITYDPVHYKACNLDKSVNETADAPAEIYELPVQSKTNVNLNYNLLGTDNEENKKKEKTDKSNANNEIDLERKMSILKELKTERRPFKSSRKKFKPKASALGNYLVPQMSYSDHRRPSFGISPFQSTCLHVLYWLVILIAASVIPIMYKDALQDSFHHLVADNKETWATFLNTWTTPKQTETVNLDKIDMSILQWLGRILRHE